MGKPKSYERDFCTCVRMKEDEIPSFSPEFMQIHSIDFLSMQGRKAENLEEIA